MMFVAISVGVAYAVAIRFLYQGRRFRRWMDPFTAGHIFGLPFSTGFVTAVIAKPDNSVSLSIAAICAYCVMILALRWQRLLSVLLNVPAFVALAIVGGMVGRTAGHSAVDSIFAGFFAALMPLAISLVETIRPARFLRIKVRRSAIIHADPKTIWERIVRVEPIQHREWGAYKLFALLGFPAPQRAELDFDGPGGLRLGIFSNRVLFREPVVVWESDRRVAFDIHVNASAVDAMPFDEFTRVGGRYFGLERAEYVLEPLDDRRVRLHLNSVHHVRTRVNWYAGLWGRMILAAFQGNILTLVKKRCEQSNRTAMQRA